MIVSNSQDLTCLDACAVINIPDNASVYAESSEESSEEESSDEESSGEESFSGDSSTKPLFAISRD
jgi:hypothetical protein